VQHKFIALNEWKIWSQNGERAAHLRRARGSDKKKGEGQKLIPNFQKSIIKEKSLFSMKSYV
jgi:hypothetical protein